jgi:hypothetical protein
MPPGGVSRRGAWLEAVSTNTNIFHILLKLGHSFGVFEKIHQLGDRPTMLVLLGHSSRVRVASLVEEFGMLGGCVMVVVSYSGQSSRTGRSSCVERNVR